MTETRTLVVVALGIAGLVLLAMAALHENHYERRRLQLLEARVGGLENIVTGDHTL